jgi:Hsp90 protein
LNAWVGSDQTVDWAASTLLLWVLFRQPILFLNAFFLLFFFQVLFLVDPMDEVAIQNLKSYKEKNFVDISKEDLDLGSIPFDFWGLFLSCHVILNRLNWL